MSPLEHQIARVVSEASPISITAIAVATVAVFVFLLLGFTAGHIVDVLHSN